MQKWEYLTIEIKFNGSRVDYLESNGKDIPRQVRGDDMKGAYDYLNKLGQDGWEMVGGGILSNSIRQHYFKRLISE